MSRIRQLYDLRELFYYFTRRELERRYKGSLLGFAWALLQPMAALSVYFVAYSVFLAHENRSLTETVLILFAGLLPYRLVQGVLTESPTAMSSRGDFIRRVIFPMELFPLTLVASAIIDVAIGWSLCLLFALFTVGLQVDILLLPLIQLPLLFWCLGFAWFLSAAGVFVGDLRTVVPILAHMLLFISPVMYPMASVPPELQWIGSSPLAIVIEAGRSILVGHAPIDWTGWSLSLLGGVVFAALSLDIFHRVRPRFADVI